MPVPIASPLPGMWVLELQPRLDPRGSFTRLFCADALRELGVTRPLAHVNLARSLSRGTLRGLHWQIAPSAETKLVTCLSGALHDCVVDLRPRSPAFGRHALVTLDATLPHAVLIPPGCAHGYLTSADDTALLYLTDRPYAPAHERAIRWDDPLFGITWPFEPLVISERDRSIPDCDRLALTTTCVSC